MTTDIPDPVPQQGLVVRMADRYGLEPAKFMQTIKATAFRTSQGISNEQLAALLLVSERHRLDPFTKEIYAYPDKGGGIVPVVGIDGWLRIINEHPQFDGMETHWDNAEASMTCTIWRKDRSHPTVVTEYLSECRRNTDAWKMVHRMMRHKATMQCGRYAFGFAGLHDEEEAQDILRGSVPRAVSPPPPSNAERFRAMQAQPEVVDVIDAQAAPPPAQEEPDLSHALADYLAALDSAAPDEQEQLLSHAQEELSAEDFNALLKAHQPGENV